MLKVIYNLPLPPSINSYYVNYLNKRILSAKGASYKRQVNYAIRKQGFVDFGLSFISLTLQLYFPDKRIRDINNGVKALEDSLVYAGVMADDVQIKQFLNLPPKFIKGGLAVVTIQEMEYVFF